MSEEQRNLVPFARSRRRPDPKRVEEFAAMARKLQHERETSHVVESILRDTPRSQWPYLASRAELATVGAVERLGQEVESRLDREPREGLAIAELATVVADALPDASYPQVVLAQTRAHAWKDRGQSLCYLARHEEALAALDHADRVLETAGTLAHDLAIVRFVRATTLQEMGRFEESLQALHECRRVFRGHGDARRTLLCGIAEGNLLHRMKRFREARDAYLVLLDVAVELNDITASAYLHHDIGYTSVDIEDFATAEHHLDQAASLFQRLDLRLNAARSESVRGVLYARRGENRRAVEQLGRMRTVFLTHGMIEEAGVFGLEIVQARLALREYGEAESLARQIITEFTRARLNTRAIGALGFLTDAIAQRTASERTVGGVREYIVSLRKQPEREFVACT